MFMRIPGMLLGLGLATSAASAQSPFMGAWKLDPLKTRMPDEMKVQSTGANTYTFDFGGGPETVVADGSDQPGIEHTLLSVKAAGPDTWIVERKKDGRLLINATWRLSNHDRKLTDAFRQFQADGSTLSMDYIYQRVGEGTGIAADWQSTKETMNSPFVLEIKAYRDDGLSLVSPFGTTNATFENHLRHDPNADQGTSKTIRRVDDRTLLVTIKHGGKIAATENVVLSPDQKNLTMTMHVVGHDRPNVMVFDRK